MTYNKKIKFGKHVSVALKTLGLLVSLQFSVTALHAQDMIVFPRSEITIGEGFDEIQRQTGLGIAYSSRLLKTDREVRLPQARMSVDTAMEALLRGTGFSYSIFSGVITIKKGNGEQVAEPTVVNTPDVPEAVEGNVEETTLYYEKKRTGNDCRE